VSEPDEPQFLERLPQMMAQSAEVRRMQQLRQVSKLVHTAKTLPTDDLVKVLAEQGWDTAEIFEILETPYEQKNP
jgi:hypothetical protein